jgi:succinyl-CoA synthetase beta subunit
VSNRDQAADDAQKIGFPVALKLISNDISHKAKMGGVKLSLDSITSVDNAVVEITRALAQHGGKHIDHFLIERMIDGPRGEYIIGIKRQAALGLAMLIGRGGVNVETLNSHSTVLLPLVDADLIKAMASIGLHETSAGYGSMLAAAQAVAAYALDHRHRLQTLDVNPVIVTENGAAIAADALIVLSTEN